MKTLDETLKILIKNNRNNVPRIVCDELIEPGERYCNDCPILGLKNRHGFNCSQLEQIIEKLKIEIRKHKLAKLLS